MIGRDEVKRIAHLARLTLQEDEVERYGRELNAIMDYVAVLDTLDVTGLKPTAHAVEVQNVFRPGDDDAVAGGITDKVLQGAPQTENGYFLVPKVL